MADMLCWRHRNTASQGLGLEPGEPIGLVMVYDSQYTKDQCTASRPTRSARVIKNATVIAVCRRLLQAVADRHTRTKWVKVKGHSEHEGNDRADDCATWGQSGGAKGEQDMESMMSYLREHG